MRQILHGPRLQPKLIVRIPDDAYEREADRVADAVMRMPELEGRLQRVCPECEEEMQRSPLGTSPSGEHSQRLCPECEEEMQRQPAPEKEEEEEEKTLRAKAMPGRIPEVTPDLESRIAALRGSGQALPASERAFFEPRLGSDFGDVRLHTGSEAAEVARGVHARAFTMGRSMVFAAGEYRPGTADRRRLLAHELVHTLQQKPQLALSRPEDGTSWRRAAPARSTESLRAHDAGPTIQRLGDVSRIPPGLSCEVAPDSPSPVIDNLMFGDRISALSGLNRQQIGNFVRNWRAAGANQPVRVDGFASRPDTDELNWRLSCERAQAVADELMHPSSGLEGIPASFISVFMHGETSEFGAEAVNRRVTLTIFGGAAPAPPTPTPAPGFRCGPDVSSQVRAAVAMVNSAWGGWDSSKRDDQCDALDSRSLGTVAWDIVDLHNQAWILGYQPTCATDGASPPCHNSVEVDNHCYYAGSANYVIFGTMCNLCNRHLGWKWHTLALRWIRGFPEWYMQHVIRLYKGPLPFRPPAANYVPSLQWATTGFRGWPSGGTPPTGDRPGCTTGCPTPYSGTPFDVNWRPHGIL